MNKHKKYFLEKDVLYKSLLPFKNKNMPIFFNCDFHSHYSLIYDWASRKPNGDFNPIMTAQLIDLKKSGSKKYVTKDLNWDCCKKNTTTQYRLYVFLRDWVQKAIKDYECKESEVEE